MMVPSQRSQDTGEFRVIEHRLDQLERHRDEDREMSRVRHEAQMAASMQIQLQLVGILGKLEAGNGRMDRLDQHLEANDADRDKIGADVETLKSGHAVLFARQKAASNNGSINPKVMIASIGGAVTGLGAIIWKLVEKVLETGAHHP